MKKKNQVCNPTFSFNKTEWTVLAALLIFTFLLFSGGLKNELLIGWDDGIYLEDAFVRNLEAASLVHFFSSYYLGMYQPLGVSTISLNYAVHGMQPFGYHLVNLLLHVLNTFLVFAFIRKLRPDGYAAFFVALLFAVHPMHVESVSWISTRSNSLYSAFFLLASMSYLDYLARDKNNKYLLLSGLFFLLALFSKSMAVSFPLLMLVFDFQMKRKISRKTILEKTPFFILSLIFGLVAIDAASDFGHIQSLAEDYNPIHRLFLISYALVFYLWKAFVPMRLSAIYTYPALSEGLLPAIYYLSLPVLIILLIMILKSGKMRRQLVSGVLYFLVTIGPVLPFYWSRVFIVAERYTYISYLGLFLMAATLLEKYFSTKHIQAFLPKSLLLTILVLWMIFLTASSYSRIPDWSETTVLLSRVIKNNRSDRDKAAAHFYRGNLHDQNRDFEAAYLDYSDAIRLFPAYTLAYNNRGIILGTMKRFDLAINDFNKVLSIDPTYAEGWYNRGIVFYQTGRKAEACADWLQASRLGSKQAELVSRQYCR